MCTVIWIGSMSDTIRVLIIEDDPIDADLMVRELRRGNFDPEWVRVDTEEKYVAELEKNPDIILSDSRLPLFDGLEALDLLKKRNLDIPFILVSGRLGEDNAVEAMKSGACDYLLKDRLARLGEAVRRAIDDRFLRSENAWAIGALRKSEERYRLVSETSSDYVYSLEVRPDGTLVCEWITDRFQRITGFDAAEINRIGWLNLYHPDDRPVSLQHEERLRAGAPDSMDIRIVRQDKSIRWMRVFERPVLSGGVLSDGAARTARIYGAAQEITVQKELEAQLLQSQKMEAIGQLAGGVAHDFNNLLTVICGYGDLLSKLPALTEEGHEYTNEILHAARRAAQLTRQLLAFGRRQVMQATTVDLNTIVADLEKLLRRLIGEDVELRIVTSTDSAFVKVDPGQIEQVVMNLAVNSRDAMPKGGVLTIGTECVDFDRNLPGERLAPEAGSHVMLSVTDTGTGMDADTAARVFEPFFTTKAPGKGTGLGLAMGYGIVTQSGGDIRVITEAGHGTTFKIYLPRVEPPAITDAEAPESDLLTLRRPETIVILEDDAPLRTLMREVLSRDGHHVFDTGDPQEALMLLEQHSKEVSLLVTDIVLPKLNGMQVAEQAAAACPSIRIMYMSGYPGKIDIPDALRPFGTEFVQKPFTADNIIRRVRAVLSRGAR
jgi:two-component system, cell cycle sensor histidine kinase and response regulator CckA